MSFIKNNITSLANNYLMLSAAEDSFSKEYKKYLEKYKKPVTSLQGVIDKLNAYHGMVLYGSRGALTVPYRARMGTREVREGVFSSTTVPVVIVGFKTASEYYEKSKSIDYLKKILKGDPIKQIEYVDYDDVKDTEPSESTPDTYYVCVVTL